MWRGRRREWGSGGGKSVESGGREIRELSLSELSCEWCVTVSDWATEIGPGPTTLICSANTHAYTQIHKTHLINDHIYSGEVFIKTCMLSEPPFHPTKQHLTKWAVHLCVRKLLQVEGTGKLTYKVLSCVLKAIWVSGSCSMALRPKLSPLFLQNISATLCRTLYMYLAASRLSDYTVIKVFYGWV